MFEWITNKKKVAELQEQIKSIVENNQEEAPDSIFEFTYMQFVVLAVVSRSAVNRDPAEMIAEAKNIVKAVEDAV